jgi:hypothetical protein
MRGALCAQPLNAPARWLACCLHMGVSCVQPALRLAGQWRSNARQPCLHCAGCAVLCTSFVCFKDFHVPLQHLLLVLIAMLRRALQVMSCHVVMSTCFPGSSFLAAYLS